MRGKHERRPLKGPWTLGFDPVPFTQLIGSGGQWAELNSPEHGGFALIVWRMEDDERSPRLEATAHLMAGAPDLLLAAMRYLNALDVWDGSNKADRHTERMEGELRAAVAKARESSNDPPPAHHLRARAAPAAT